MQASSFPSAPYPAPLPLRPERPLQAANSYTVRSPSERSTLLRVLVPGYARLYALKPIWSAPSSRSGRCGPPR